MDWDGVDLIGKIDDETRVNGTGGVAIGGNWVEYGNSSVENGGRFDGSRFDGGRFNGGRFNGDRFDGGRFDSDRFDGDRFDGGRFGGGRFGDGRFDGEDVFETFHFLAGTECSPNIFETFPSALFF